MITFKTFLTEARMAPLYHATQWDNIESIMRNGIEPRTVHNTIKLYGRNGKGLTRRGVSTTRNFDFAKDWSAGLIIELNQEAIDQRYRIVPFQYWSYTTREHEKQGSKTPRANEYEEFIITDKPISPKYFKCLHVSDRYLTPGSWLHNIIDKIVAKHGKSFIKAYHS